jgi:hypothetical protein
MLPPHELAQFRNAKRRDLLPACRPEKLREAIAAEAVVDIPFHHMVVQLTGLFKRQMAPPVTGQTLPGWTGWRAIHSGNQTPGDQYAVVHSRNKR